MEVPMQKHSSGVLAASVVVAGLFGGCTESTDSGVSPVEGNSSAAVLLSSADFRGDGTSSAENPVGSSSGETLVSSSSAFPPVYSSASLPVSSSSEIEFVYVAPANFSDTVNGAVFDMVYVAGGAYTRGCDNCAEQDKIYETPAHKVTVGDYHVASTEVTIAQWNAVMGGKRSAWESDKAPKIGVSWFDANSFACKLGQLSGRQYRLLTDAEWEFAARGGKDGVVDNFKFSGSNTADDVAWYSENSGGKAHDVATKKPNRLGLYDMSGNSWEWVYDWLVGYTSGDKVNPVQLTGSGNKTRRGGSYGEPAEFARVSRRAIRSRDGAADMGFRIGVSSELPPGMVGPCEAANPSAAICSGDKNRDCRLITAAEEAWISDD
jgi:formylglycine-generating enzyme required for sulfatase activity